MPNKSKIFLNYLKYHLLLNLLQKSLVTHSILIQQIRRIFLLAGQHWVCPCQSFCLLR